MSLNALDRLDRKILLELDLDASQSLSQIARRLRLGNDLIEYRMKRFLRDGVITRLTPTINPSALGFHVFKTYLKHRLPESLRRGWLKKINTDPHTYWLVEGYGRWDLLVSVAAASFSEFQDILDRHLGELGAYIVDLAVFPLIEVTRYPKSYLLPEAKRSKGQQRGWKSASAVVPLDDLERRILWSLSENCRKTDSELADAFKVSPAMIRSRREGFQKNGVVVGHRVQLDYKVLEMVLVKVFLELKDHSKKSRDLIQGFCEKEASITCFSNQLGTFPLEFEAEVPSYQGLSELLDRFREEFSHLCSRIEYMILTNDHYHRVPKI